MSTDNKKQPEVVKNSLPHILKYVNASAHNPSLKRVNKEFREELKFINDEYRKTNNYKYFQEHLIQIQKGTKARFPENFTRDLRRFMYATDSVIAGSSLVSSIASTIKATGEESKIFDETMLNSIEVFQKNRMKNPNSDIDVWVPYPESFVDSVSKRFLSMVSISEQRKKRVLDYLEKEVPIIWLRMCAVNYFPDFKLTRNNNRKSEYTRLNHYVTSILTSKEYKIQFILLHRNIDVVNAVRSFDIIGLQFMLRGVTYPYVSSYDEYLTTFMDVSDNQEALNDLKIMNIRFSKLALEMQSPEEWLRTFNRVDKYIKSYMWTINSDVIKEAKHTVKVPNVYAADTILDNEYFSGGGSLGLSRVKKFMKIWNRNVEKMFDGGHIENGCKFKKRDLCSMNEKYCMYDK